MSEDRRNLINAARRLLVRSADAEDAVQDAYLKALTHWPDLHSAPAAWLHTVLRNLTIDRLRRNQLESGVKDPETPCSESPEAWLERESDCLAALRRLLSRTSPIEAAALLLREVFELDHAEISRILGKQEAATRQFLHRARLRARSEAETAQADDALVAQCARALGSRAPQHLIDLIQTCAPCVALSTTGLAAPLGVPMARRSPVASAQLVQVNGKYVMALVLDGIVLCVVPVGTTEGTAACV